MSFIRFDFDTGTAKVWLDNCAENGWCFDYDNQQKMFRVWESVEKESMGNDPDYIVETLNEVCTLIKSFR